MADIPKMIRQGKLTEKKQQLKEVINALKARINFVAVTIQPALDIEDQKFDLAAASLNECVDLEKKYNCLKNEIRELEESL